MRAGSQVGRGGRGHHLLPVLDYILLHGKLSGRVGKIKQKGRRKSSEKGAVDEDLKEVREGVM